MYHSVGDAYTPQPVHLRGPRFFAKLEERCMAWVPDCEDLIDPVMLAAYRLTRHRRAPKDLAANPAGRSLKLGHISLVFIAIWIPGSNRVAVEV